MRVIEFSFADKWFDLAIFPLRSIMHPFHKHDGTVRKYQAKWNRYLEQFI